MASGSGWARLRLKNGGTLKGRIPAAINRRRSYYRVNRGTGEIMR
nr:MAG TPA: hypothetical protein [Caudoviricetes sp.]